MQVLFFKTIYLSQLLVLNASQRLVFHYISSWRHTDSGKFVYLLEDCEEHAADIRIANLYYWFEDYEETRGNMY